MLTIENTNSDLKVHLLYYANELLVRVKFSFQNHLQIVVKFNFPLFYRYFYNHLSNYTKTIIRLRLVDIGEYSPRLCLGEYSPVFTSPSAMICLLYLQHKTCFFSSATSLQDKHKAVLCILSSPKIF